jgi:hypothetical protein
MSECLLIESGMNETDFFKKRCDTLEKDLFKSQTQNKKNEALIKKLQEMIALYGKVNSYNPE